MHMITTGNVTLPDGREVHAVERWAYDYTDGFVSGSDQLSIEIEWLDGTPLEADEYNELVQPGSYLHEFVSEQLAKTGQTEPHDPDPF